MKHRAFISHIADESSTATLLKAALGKDFLGLLDVFVSSDEESISAGDAWLDSISVALQEAHLMLILCSPASVRRPWVNFEAGAAWMRNIPIIPLCHAGLRPVDLPMPLSSRHGLSLSNQGDLRKLYSRVARVLACTPPVGAIDNLAESLAAASSVLVIPDADSVALQRERDIRQRMTAALQNTKFKWRTLERVAIAAGVSQEEAAEYLRGAPTIRFSKGKSGKIIVGLKAKVDG